MLKTCRLFLLVSALLLSAGCMQQALERGKDSAEATKEFEATQMGAALKSAASTIHPMGEAAFTGLMWIVLFVLGNKKEEEEEEQQPKKKGTK